MDAERLESLLARRTPEPVGTARRFAVLVPLVRLAGRTHLLYEVRSASLHRQPGEICFPGGHVEPGETPLDCALRETREELGIPPERVRVLGAMDFLVNRDRSVLYPTLALVDSDAARALIPCAEEVDRPLLIPADELLAAPPLCYDYELVPRLPDNFPYEALNITRDYPWIPGKSQGLVYRWQGHAIWGMTGLITRCALELLKEG